MKNMDKGLTVPKWVWPINTPNAPEYISTQFVCPSPKVLDFNEKRLRWASAVRVFMLRKMEMHISVEVSCLYGQNSDHVLE